MSSGKIVKVVVAGELFKTTYKPQRPGSFYTIPVTTMHKEILNKDDTYISIFGNAQDEYLEKVLKDKDINILFKSHRAYNRNMGYYRGPRNTVVVYELK